MVRKRSRRYKQRRYRKYKSKLDPDIIARRFAQVREVSSVSWGSIVPHLVRTEAKTIEVLEKAGIPTEEYPYYLGAAKEAAAEATNYTAATLADNIDIMRDVYEIRGLEPTVLETVIPLNSEITVEMGLQTRADYDTVDKDLVHNLDPAMQFADACVADHAITGIPYWIVGKANEGRVDESYVELGARKIAYVDEIQVDYGEVA